MSVQEITTNQLRRMEGKEGLILQGCGGSLLDWQNGINNLMGIYSTITGKTYEEIEHEFEGRGYGDFKEAVGTAVVEHLRPIQQRFVELSKDKAYLESLYTEHAHRASALAQRTLSKVMKKIGYIPMGR